MRVFISWSGERSRAFATALRDWLPMVLQTVDTWLSAADISAGDRWAWNLAEMLENSSFGVICLTRENLASPWLLFEAGALAKDLKHGKVVPLLLDLDLKDLSGPLTQFQAKKAEREGMLDVVTALNTASDIKLADGKLNKQFAALWPELERSIGHIRAIGDNQEPKRPQDEILEDLVANVRSFGIKLQEVSERANSNSRRDEALVTLQHGMRTLLDKSHEADNSERKFRTVDEAAASVVTFFFQTDIQKIARHISGLTITVPFSRTAEDISRLIEQALKERIGEEELAAVHWFASKVLFSRATPFDRLALTLNDLAVSLEQGIVVRVVGRDWRRNSEDDEMI